MVTGVPAGAERTITVTTTVTDTGERKQMFGYTARHLKATVVEESSKNACSQVNQKYEIDGWHADLAQEQTVCSRLDPPIPQGGSCHDRVVSRHIGSGKPGYPLAENITIQNSDTGCSSNYPEALC